MASAAAASAPVSTPPLPPRAPSRRARLALLADRDLGSRSDAELIAQVLAGPEPAAEVMRCAVRLARLPFWERRALGVAGLITEHAVAPDRAVRLAALWELAERWYPDERPAVTAPRDALLLVDGLRTALVEQVVVLLLDARQRPVGRETVAVGTVNASRLQAREVFTPVLRAGAAAFVLVHNHPSGDPTPSRADRQVTRALREGALLIGVSMLDHLVIARNGHHSFREAEGWDLAGDRPVS
ncbi:MAG: DNA repair protein RadC [Candidatus Dormibacteria bacterium]